MSSAAATAQPGARALRPRGRRRRDRGPGGRARADRGATRSASVCVLEREAEIGTHQTGHNSGVIHAGVYYVPGSLKARLCVEGARELYEYCAQRGIAQRALREGDRRDRHLRARPAGGARAPGQGQRGARPAPDRRRRHRGDRAPRARDRRPALAGHRASSTSRPWRAPTPGTCSTRAAPLATGCEVEGVDVEGRSLRLAHSHGGTEAGHAVFCAGAWADRLAVAAGADPDPRIVPFRGAYLRLVPERRHLVRSLIYPVPDPSLPFLGVHLTRHIDGEVLIGPTALMAGARDAYRLATVRRRDLLDTLAWPGTWRMLARWWSTGRDRAAPRGAALRVRPRRRALRARAAGAATSSPRSPACARRRSPATAGSSTTSSSPGPSGRCTCATRPRRPPPPRWRSPATWPTRPSGRSDSSANFLGDALACLFDKPPWRRSPHPLHPA